MSQVMLARVCFKSKRVISSAMLALKCHHSNLKNCTHNLEIEHPALNKIFETGRKYQRYHKLIDMPFLMPVEDTFAIEGKGTVIVGRVEQGTLDVGDEIEIVGENPTKKTKCLGLESSKKSLTHGEAGDNVGVLLHGVDRSDVRRGDVLSACGALKTYKKFKAEGYFFPYEVANVETLLQTPADADNEKQNSELHFFFRTFRASGSISSLLFPITSSDEWTISMTVDLMSPVPMAEGLHFVINKKGRSAGFGVVTKVLTE